MPSSWLVAAMVIKIKCRYVGMINMHLFPLHKIQHQRQLPSITLQYFSFPYYKCFINSTTTTYLAIYRHYRTYTNCFLQHIVSLKDFYAEQLSCLYLMLVLQLQYCNCGQNNHDIFWYQNCDVSKSHNRSTLTPT